MKKIIHKIILVALVMVINACGLRPCEGKIEETYIDFLALKYCKLYNQIDCDELINKLRYSCQYTGKLSQTCVIWDNKIEPLYDTASFRFAGEISKPLAEREKIRSELIKKLWSTREEVITSDSYNSMCNP